MKEPHVDLGPFSLSLPVADLTASRAFYERLGFSRLDGDDTSWVLLAAGLTKIGLFRGLFDRTTLTFHPSDVRAAQRTLKTDGLEFVVEADDATTGPAHAMLLDPDGNPILLDQTA